MRKLFWKFLERVTGICMLISWAVCFIGMGTDVWYHPFTDVWLISTLEPVNSLATVIFFTLAYRSVRYKVVIINDEEIAADVSKHHEQFDELSYDYVCPHCRNAIARVAKRCLHCSSELKGAE